MKKKNVIKLNKDVVMVCGANRAAIYNFNDGNVYSINENAKTLLLEIYKNKKMIANSDTKKFITKLINFGLLDIEYIGDFDVEKSSAPSLFFAWLELTEICNEKCVHCYESFHDKDRNITILNFDFWKQAIDQLKESGCRSIQLIGGEPLLYPEILKIIEYAYLKKLETTIFTNATMLDDNTIQFCKDKGVGFRVSLYGHNAEIHDCITQMSGSFEKTINNIKKIKKQNIPISIAVIIMKENQDYIEQIKEFILNLELTYDGFDLIRKVYGGCQDEHLVNNTKIKKLKYLSFPAFFAEKKFFQRAIGYNTCWGNKIAITSNGKVIPCVFERDIILGDLKINNITDIVNSEEFNFISTLSKDKIEICKDCEFRYACKDCRPLGKSLDGNLWGKYAYCTYNPYIGRWQDVSGH